MREDYFFLEGYPLQNILIQPKADNFIKFGGGVVDVLVLAGICGCLTWDMVKIKQLHNAGNDERLWTLRDKRRSRHVL
jgi:hypothetical protein